MSTRTSARNRNKAKVDYNPPEDDENTDTLNPKPKRTRAKKTVTKKAVSDSDDDYQTDDLSPQPTKKKRGRKPATKKASSSDSSSDSAADDDDTKDEPTTKAALGKRKQRGRKAPPSPIPEDKDMVTKKQKIETKIESKIKEENLSHSRCLVAVDVHCTIKASVSVYSDADGPWDAMLNQTNVGMNNNKYYLLQLLHNSSLNTYYVWFRWGRIGYSNKHQSSLKTFHSIDAAKKAFTKKFWDKTKNRWEERNDYFEKYPGKYDLIKLDYTVKEDEVEVDGAEKVKEEPVDSKLDPRLLSLMELISDVKAMETAVIEMNYDVKKSPLGKLSKEQIKSGYEALTIIEECIREGKAGNARAREACSMFYTRIPHSFGFQVPPMINNMEEVKLKIELLDTLIDIEAAVRAIRTGLHATEHKADSFYNNLKIEMKPLEKDGEMFSMLSAYLHNTHGQTHSHYTLEVEDIFELKKEGEEERFSDVGNKQLLWHGSRITNWGGIFSQGLRIAPPEAPVTGYMFGKGVYFADMASKSANYCFTSRAQPTGILMLAEVALGEERSLMSSDCHADKLPAGKHSTKGLGKTAPDPSQTKYIGDVTVPMGTAANTGVNNQAGYTLQYNEFIVYDVKQVKMKYALRVKFNYKR